MENEIGETTRLKNPEFLQASRFIGTKDEKPGI
jgi:hypothetical protein